MKQSYNNIVYANQGPNGRILDTGDIIDVKFLGNSYQLISIFDDDNEEFKIYNSKTRTAYSVESLTGFIGGLLMGQQYELFHKYSANIANILIKSDKRDFKTKLIQNLNFDCKVLHESNHQSISLQEIDVKKLYRENLIVNKLSSGQLHIKDGWNELFLSQLINGRHICGHYMLCFDNLTYIITEYRDQNGSLSYYFNAAAFKSQYLFDGKQFGYITNLTGRPDNKNSYTLFQYLGYMPSTKEFVGGYLNGANIDVFRFLPFDSSDQMLHQELTNPSDHHIIRLTHQHPDLSKNNGDVSFA